VYEKFELINGYIERGEEVPKELTKDFITFPLVDDPYSSITHLNTHTQKLTKSLCIGVLKMAGNVSGLCVIAPSRKLKLTTTLDRAITQNPC
jgi:hypothetical protein